MRTQKRLSTLIELCSIAIKKKMKGSRDSEREIILQTQCKKFNVNEAYVKKLIFANEEAIPVIPRGGASSCMGSSSPTRGGISLDIKAMNRVIEINVEEKWARVEPGISFDILETRSPVFALFKKNSWPGCNISKVPNTITFIKIWE